MHRVQCGTANVGLIKHLTKLFSNEVGLGRPPGRISSDESLISPVKVPTRHERLTNDKVQYRLQAFTSEDTMTPDTRTEKIESFKRTNSICKTNGNFGSCNSCKRPGTSRLYELHESKLPFVSLHVSSSSVRNFQLFLLMYPGFIESRRRIPSFGWQWCWYF